MEKEKLEKSLIGTLGEFYRQHYGESLIFEWRDGIKFLAVIDTLSETDNGKELNEEGYEEYHACFITVKSLINNKTNSDTILHRFGRNLLKEEGYEISYINAPDKIYTIDKSVIWSKDNF